MKKKIKIIDSTFDKETGVSKVTIQTPKGTYVGTSILRNEDKDFVSSFAGCRYAEIKARRKALNEDIKELKIQLSAFEKFYSNLTCGKQFDSSSYEARKIRRQMYELRDKIKNLEKLKMSMTDNLKDSFNKRQSEIVKFYNSLAKSD